MEHKILILLASLTTLPPTINIMKGVQGTNTALNVAAINKLCELRRTMDGVSTKAAGEMENLLESVYATRIEVLHLQTRLEAKDKDITLHCKEAHQILAAAKKKVNKFQSELKEVLKKGTNATGLAGKSGGRIEEMVMAFVSVRQASAGCVGKSNSDALAEVGDIGECFGARDGLTAAISEKNWKEHTSEESAKLDLAKLEEEIKKISHDGIGKANIQPNLDNGAGKCGLLQGTARGIAGDAALDTGHKISWLGGLITIGHQTTGQIDGSKLVKTTAGLSQVNANHVGWAGSPEADIPHFAAAAGAAKEFQEAINSLSKKVLEVQRSIRDCHGDSGEEIENFNETTFDTHHQKLLEENANLTSEVKNQRTRLERYRREKGELSPSPKAPDGPLAGDISNAAGSSTSAGFRSIAAFLPFLSMFI